MEWQTDWGLRARMALTMLLLFGLYVVFVGVLTLYFENLLIPIVLLGSFSLVQYFFSDRLALRSMGARRVDPDEYPRLHDRVGRLAQQADLPEPDVAVADSRDRKSVV